MVGVDLVAALIMVTMAAVEVVVPVALVLMVKILMADLVVMEHDILFNMVQITQHITREVAEVLVALEVLLEAMLV